MLNKGKKSKRERKEKYDKLVEECEKTGNYCVKREQ